MAETLTDIKTGQVYTVETDEQMASELFPWLRGTEYDRVVTVGRLVKELTDMPTQDKTGHSAKRDEE